MTQKDSIIDVIVGMIGELPHGARVVGPETNIARELGLDSLAVMNFVMALEDRFDVSIPMDTLAGIETVDDLAAAIADLKGR
jgi:acyl carrier protein